MARVDCEGLNSWILLENGLIRAQSNNFYITFIVFDQWEGDFVGVK